MLFEIEEVIYIIKKLCKICYKSQLKIFKGHIKNLIEYQKSINVI